MSVVFTKSPLASALEKGLLAIVAIVVGAVFAAVSILTEDPPLILWIVSGLIVLCSVWMTFKIIGEAISILKSGQEWRVEIDSTHLSWHSPAPEVMESFSVRLADIHTVRHVYTQYRNSKRSPSNDFFIEFTNGYVMELKEQMVGIPPIKVFKALQDKSINFIQEQKFSGSKIKTIMSS